MVTAEKQRSQSRQFSLFGAIPPSSINTVHIISEAWLMILVPEEWIWWDAMWLIFHSIIISVSHYPHLGFLTK